VRRFTAGSQTVDRGSAAPRTAEARKGDEPDPEGQNKGRSLPGRGGWTGAPKGFAAVGIWVRAWRTRTALPQPARADRAELVMVASEAVLVGARARMS
jgi:hypothetical protein